MEVQGLWAEVQELRVELREEKRARHVTCACLDRMEEALGGISGSFQDLQLCEDALKKYLSDVAEEEEDEASFEAKTTGSEEGSEEGLEMPEGKGEGEGEGGAAVAERGRRAGGGGVGHCGIYLGI